MAFAEINQYQWSPFKLKPAGWRANRNQEQYPYLRFIKNKFEINIPYPLLATASLKKGEYVAVQYDLNTEFFRVGIIKKDIGYKFFYPAKGYRAMVGMTLSENLREKFAILETKTYTPNYHASPGIIVLDFLDIPRIK